MKIINKKNLEVVVESLQLADNPFKRLRGLLFTKELKKGHGLWLIPCNGIHMFGMGYAIDVLYLDKHNRVVKMIKQLLPNRLGPIVMQAKSIIEIPAGHLDQIDLSLNDELEAV